MNSVILMGRMTKDPEYKVVGDGGVCSFTVAVDRNYKNANGEKEADFINCVCWNGRGKAIADFFSKGKKIAVRGSVRTRTYDDSEGKKRYVTEILVEEFDFPESKNGGAGASSRGDDHGSNDMIPTGDETFLPINDEDIPF